MIKYARFKPDMLVTYKAKTYKVIDEVRFKHPINREWYAAVLYKDLVHGHKYVRELGEFLDRFEEDFRDGY